MPHIYDEGRVSVHVHNGEPEVRARCFDLQDDEMKTLVEIDLLAFLPWSYGQEAEEPHLPSWQFVIEAMRSCAEHGDELWQAWASLSNDPLF